MKQPNDVEIEKSILSSCLIFPESAKEIVEIITYEVFYNTLNAKLFRKIQKAVDKKIEIDIDAFYLEFEDQTERAKAKSFLKALIEFPVSTNIAHHCKKLKELYALRQLAVSCNNILAMMQQENIEPVEIIDQAQKEINSIEINNPDKDSLSVRNICGKVMDDIEEKFLQPRDVTGVPSGFTRQDYTLHGYQPSDFIILAARPSMGKTAKMINEVKYAAKKGFPVIVFSLEMSKEQLVYRFLSQSTGINLDNLFTGRIEKSMFENINESLSKLYNYPIYIDDSAGISVFDMRRKLRAAQKEHGIKIAYIDYLQLMRGEAKPTRDREIADISSGIKNTAKELNIPIIALSQLNRNLESRPNKRPILADLRDCLSKKTTFMLTTDGALKYSGSHINTYSLNTQGEIIETMSTNIPKTTNKLLRLLLKSGRYIDASAKHPILTDRGFVCMKNLTVEHSVACVRHIPEPIGTINIPHARWLGWMLGNGSMRGYSSPSFICSCETLANKFIETTGLLFGLIPKAHPHKCKKVWQYDITAGPVRTAEGNPCKDWLREHGMWDRLAWQKEIPDWFIQQANNVSIAELIGGLFDTDGSVVFSKQKKYLKYSTTSEKLLWQVIQCMARLNIYPNIETDGRDNKLAKHHLYNVYILCGKEIQRFKNVIKLTGRKGTRLDSIIPSEQGSNFGDRLGTWVGKEIVRRAGTIGISQNRFGYRDQGKRISKDDLAKQLKILGSVGDDIKWLTSEHLFWDKIKSVSDIGEDEVFDQYIPGHHNFIANGIVVHNSGTLEQDADIIQFLYRPEPYIDVKFDTNGAETKEYTEAKNKAEIIIAKHRNGRTGVVYLYWKPENTSFYNQQTER